MMFRRRRGCVLDWSRRGDRAIHVRARPSRGHDYARMNGAVRVDRSGCVVHMPCGQPRIDLDRRFRSLIASSARSAIGTIWSSSPCMTSVGTAMRFRSS